MGKLQQEEDFLIYYLRKYSNGSTDSLDNVCLGWFCWHIDEDRQFGRFIRAWSDSEELRGNPLWDEHRNEYFKRIDKYRKRWIATLKRLIDKGIVEASWIGTGPGGQHDGFGKRARRYDLKEGV